jgi:hypothetical protein
MIEEDEIIIKSKLDKSILLFLGCVLFVYAGYFLWNNYESFASKRYNPTFMKGVSLICIVFFGYIGILRLIDLIKFKPALVITKSGIYNHSNGVSGFHIQWNEIKRFELSIVKRTKFILIYVKNPDKFMAQVGFMKRFFMKMNNKMYGTPISITTNTLPMRAEALLKLLKENKKKNDA